MFFSLSMFISGRVQKNAFEEDGVYALENREQFGGFLFLRDGISDMSASLSLCNMDPRFIYATAQNYLERLTNCTDFSFYIFIKGTAEKLK